MTTSYRGLREVRQFLQGVTICYKGLQKGDKGFQRGTGADKGIQGVTWGDKGLQRVTGGDRGLQKG